MEIEPDPVAVFETSGIETETLEEAVLRDHLTVGGPDYYVSTLLERGDIRIVDDAQRPDYVASVERLLESANARYDDCKTTVALPVPGEAVNFLSELKAIADDLARKQKDFLKALAALDRYVLSLYGITEVATCQLIGRGMPWASMRTDWADAVANQLSEVPDPASKGARVTV